MIYVPDQNNDLDIVKKILVDVESLSNGDLDYVSYRVYQIKKRREKQDAQNLGQLQLGAKNV